ncbi:MAG: hypothetical protein ABIR66_12060 [Saprospiraceae bacterium]
MELVMGKKERIKKLKKARKEKIGIKNVFIKAALKEDVIAEASSKLKSKISKDTKIRYNQGKIKYSEVLSEFVSPIMNADITDLDSIKYLYTLGVLSWNRVVLNQEPKLSKMIRDIDKVIDELDIESRDQFQFLMDRKQQFYTAYNIIYSNFEIAGRDGEFGISTAVMNLDDKV